MLEEGNDNDWSIFVLKVFIFSMEDLNILPEKCKNIKQKVDESKQGQLYRVLFVNC